MMILLSSSWVILLLISASDAFTSLGTTTTKIGNNYHNVRNDSVQRQNWIAVINKRKNLYSTTQSKESSLSVPTKSVQQGGDGVVVGDTKGAAIVFEDIAISRGSNQILSNVNFRIERNQRWGIVGPNGVGKSTLLGCLTGTVRKDEGQALIAPKLRLGYLRQTAVAGSTKTVFEEAASEMYDINEARKRMDIAQAAVEAGDTSDEALEALDNASADFTSAGGWTQEQDVDTVLKGLGFQPEDSDRLCSDFSGGWQMRIALARLLLSRPNVLLLDEPSNHLDSSARDWLGKYLASFEGMLAILNGKDFSQLEFVRNILFIFSVLSLLN